MTTQILQHNGRCVTIYGELHLANNEYPIVDILTSLPPTTTIILEGNSDMPMHDCGIKAAHELLNGRALSIHILTDYWRPFVKAARSAILRPTEKTIISMYALAAQLQTHPLDFFHDNYNVPSTIRHKALATYNSRRIEYLDNLDAPMVRYRALLSLATLQFEIEVYNAIHTSECDCVVYCGRSHIEAIKYFCD